MTTADDCRFPAALAAALSGPFQYGDDSGVDFEPFDHFLPAADATDWLRAWTGNRGLSGDGFRMFGRDGSGGHAAFWLTNPGRVIDDQPVVFLGSEGDAAVVARDLPDFLWLLAGGYGPLEATPAFTTVYQPNWIPRPNPELIATAERFAGGPRRAAAEVIERAAREFPDFDSTMMELCR
ncbi:SMI1/KNR4 family protein [Streptomyces sp. NPDC057116]|uniref:SMI1/KNR4 family protein n=1 Tax=Streptomyces sp. NPDC057116 TaxID=3346023 RepID=UPI00362F7D18